MTSIFGPIRRFWMVDHGAQPAKSSDAIRIGLLGASSIAPSALISPANSHPEVIIAAIAARDRAKAETYAKKHKIPKIHNSYQDLLDDPSIDAVYIPLPNGLHFEWTMKALRAGKHVLLEKPSTSNADEARALFGFHKSLPSTASKPRPVLLEASFYRFHPSWQAFLSLLSPQNIESAECSLLVWKGLFKKDDIRFIYDLAGGCIMDLGHYPLSTMRQVFGTEPSECLSAEPRLMPEQFDQKCDEACEATYRFPNGGIGIIHADLQKAPSFMGLPAVDIPWITVKHKAVPIQDQTGTPEGQTHFIQRTVTNWLFMAPHVWHRLDIVDEHVIKNSEDGKVIKSWTVKESKKAYTWDGAGKEGEVRTGEDYWSGYRHMLEQFVNKVKGRQGSGVWVDGDDSVNQMAMVDATYIKAGLPIRPTSTFK